MTFYRIQFQGVEFQRALKNSNWTEFYKLDNPDSCWEDIVGMIDAEIMSDKKGGRLKVEASHA